MATLNIKARMSTLCRLTGFVIVMVLIIGCFGLFTARNIMLKYRIEKILESKMGLQVHLGNVRSTLLLNRIEIYGVTVENPAIYKRRLFMYLPRVVMLTDLPKFLNKDQLRLFLLDFEIEKINIIRNAEGQVNLKDIAGLIESRPGMGRKILADYIRYDIKDAFFYDEIDKQADIRAYSIDVYDITYKNTDSFEDVVDSVMREVMAKAKLGETLNFMTDKFFANIKDLKKAPSKFADAAAKTSEGLFKLSRKNKTNIDQLSSEEQIH